MKAALLPDRGVIKVAGQDARPFLNGLVTADLASVGPGQARFAALLTPQGKIIADFIIAEASQEDGGGFFLDAPRALAQTLVARLNLYKLRAKVLVEDLSETLGVMAAWDGVAETDYGLVYADPRLPTLGGRVMLPPHLAAEAATDAGAEFVDAEQYESHRIALAIPRGGLDFMYNDAFPHETAMDQLGGVDFDKGCYVGQEVVSRMHHRGSVRTRIMGVGYETSAPEAGVPVMGNGKQVGVMGSGADGRGVALLRLDRLADALAGGHGLEAGGISLQPITPVWARYGLANEKAAADKG